MRLVDQFRRRLRAIATPVLGVSLVGYFAYHVFVGDRSVLAWLQLNQELRDAQATYAAVHTDKEALERRVNLLRSAHIDPDMLDERVRAVLQMGGPNEIVIPLPGPTPQ
jgi:cell division protein FtsB